MHPATQGEFGMYLARQWYRCRPRIAENDGNAVERLDVSASLADGRLHRCSASSIRARIRGSTSSAVAVVLPNCSGASMAANTRSRLPCSRLHWPS